MRFAATEIAAAVGGQLIVADDGSAPDVMGASIDTRSIGATDLFVPIVAERNGHDFVNVAVDEGVGLYLSAQGRLDHRAACIAVADTAQALMDLGASARDRMAGPVVGITGSVGKTSVKDLTAAACSVGKVVQANPASFNNELGLPLTLFNAPDQVEITVVEMGSRGAGHIAELCVPARPTVGVITRVAAAHTEQFGSLQDVAAAKGELIDALPADGTAVLNADDPLVAGMAQRCRGTVLTFGETSADIATGPITLDESLRPSFVLRTPQGSVALRLPMAGAHMAINAAAAVAAALAAGCALDEAAEGISSVRLSPMRMDVVRTPAGATLINDAYNANPTSVAAALDALRNLSAKRRIAVLGIMAELGQEEADAHQSIAASAAEAGIQVIAVDAPPYGPGVIHVDSPNSAAEAIGVVDADTAILVKGSRVAELERLVELMLVPADA